MFTTTKPAADPRRAALPWPVAMQMDRGNKPRRRTVVDNNWHQLLLLQPPPANMAVTERYAALPALPYLRCLICVALHALPYDHSEACSHRWLLHWTRHRDVASSNWGLGSNITLPPPLSLSGSRGISCLGLVGSVSGSRVISLRVSWDLSLGLIGGISFLVS